jgi:hypothetical protein
MIERLSTEISALPPNKQFEPTVIRRRMRAQQARHFIMRLLRAG